jgi:3-phosphoinositide dependent protein kinase-1
MDSDPKPVAIKECNNCHKTNVDMFRCAGCTIYYCSRECQRADWKIHKPICSYKPTPQPDISMDKPSNNRSDDFILLKKCGTGNFSEIWEAKCKSDGKIYAVKVIPKQRVKSLHKENDVLMEKHVL